MTENAINLVIESHRESAHWIKSVGPILPVGWRTRSVDVWSVLPMLIWVTHNKSWVMKWQWTELAAMDYPMFWTFHEEHTHEWILLLATFHCVTESAEVSDKRRCTSIWLWNQCFGLAIALPLHHLARANPSVSFADRPSSSSFRFWSLNNPFSSLDGLCYFVKRVLHCRTISLVCLLPWLRYACSHRLSSDS
jgi:hypothetical protein